MDRDRIGYEFTLERERERERDELVRVLILELMEAHREAGHGGAADEEAEARLTGMLADLPRDQLNELVGLVRLQREERDRLEREEREAVEREKRETAEREELEGLGAMPEEAESEAEAAESGGSPSDPYGGEGDLTNDIR